MPPAGRSPGRDAHSQSAPSSWAYSLSFKPPKGEHNYINKAIKSIILKNGFK